MFYQQGSKIKIKTIFFSYFVSKVKLKLFKTVLQIFDTFLEFISLLLINIILL